MEKREDLSVRFQQYLLAERALEVEKMKSADRNYVEAQKRIRQIDRELETIRGGAL